MSRKLYLIFPAFALLIFSVVACRITAQDFAWFAIMMLIAAVILAIIMIFVVAGRGK